MGPSSKHFPALLHLSVRIDPASSCCDQPSVTHFFDLLNSFMSRKGPRPVNDLPMLQQSVHSFQLCFAEYDFYLMQD